jgi:hypothetical protein
LEYFHPQAGGGITARILDVECNEVYEDWCNQVENVDLPYFMQGFSFVGPRSVEVYTGDTLELVIPGDEVCAATFFEDSLFNPVYLTHGCEVIADDEVDLHHMASLQFSPFGFADSRTIIENLMFELWGYDKMVVRDRTACNSVTFQVANQCRFDDTIECNQ